MIEYPKNQKRYNLLHANKGEFVVSRDFIFSERPSTDAIVGNPEIIESGGSLMTIRDPTTDPTRTPRRIRRSTLATLRSPPMIRVTN